MSAQDLFGVIRGVANVRGPFVVLFSPVARYPLYASGLVNVFKITGTTRYNRVDLAHKCLHNLRVMRKPLEQRGPQLGDLY